MDAGKIQNNTLVFNCLFIYHFFINQLAGRRHLALQNLNNFNDEVKKFYRNSKYEVSCAEFAICDLFKSHW